MADDTETPKPAAKPRAPRRRSTSATKTPSKPRRSTAKGETSAAKTTPAKRGKSTAPLKPRSTTRATPAPKVRPPAKPAAASAPEKSRGRWGVAAAVGGLAALGAAATAALLSLRGSTPRDPKPEGGAHMADGEDASKSFEAGIADEGTIPDKA